MKTFNSYEHSLTIDKVYIKLNDEVYLYVGEFRLSIDDEDDIGSYENVWKSSDKLGIRSPKNEGDFKREEKFDGYEFEVPLMIQKSIIKKTFDGKNA